MAIVSDDLFCSGCGYNLKGLGPGRCPECGCAFDPISLLIHGHFRPWPSSRVLASRTQRWCAFCLDAALLGLSVGAGALIAGWNVHKLTRLISLPLALWWAIQTLTLAMEGQTLGKMQLGLRVVRYDGQPAGLFRAVVVRFWLTGLLWLIPFFALVDGAYCLFNRRRQCFHDRLAGTIVVDVRRHERWK